MSVPTRIKYYAPIIGEIDFGSKTQKLSIEDNGTAVVPTTPVHKRKTDVNKDAMELGISQDCEE